MSDVSRRTFIKGLSAGAALAGLPTLAAATNEFPSIAQDEAYWREVGEAYTRTKGILNLEHGYWGRMARPVRETYLNLLKMVNQQNSYYARREFPEDDEFARERVARALGAKPSEVAITRNATEACHNMIRQYRGLEPDDSVLLADIDYPGFKPVMRSLGGSADVDVIELQIPNRATAKDILAMYVDEFERRPSLKLALLTHASNQHGLVLPVADIMAAARKHNVDVICDSAQSWGLLDYQVGELDVDYAAFNLHKWIGAPLGTGLMYVREGSIDRIAPYPGESDEYDTRIDTRLHPGTVDFAARLTIPAAVHFHEEVGPANKEARLRYLRSLWTEEADTMPHIEVLGARDEADWSGIASFRLRGRYKLSDATELQLRLEKEFGIFTVVRKGLASGACVRITPQVFTTPDEISQLTDALRKLA